MEKKQNKMQILKHFKLKSSGMWNSELECFRELKTGKSSTRLPRPCCSKLFFTDPSSIGTISWFLVQKHSLQKYKKSSLSELPVGWNIHCSHCRACLQSCPLYCCCRPYCYQNQCCCCCCQSHASSQIATPHLSHVYFQAPYAQQRNQ